jgi:hypothetical protein
MEVLDELERRFAAAIEAEQRQAGKAGGKRAAGADAPERPPAGRVPVLRPRALPRRRSRDVRRRLRALPLATGGALAALAAVAAVVVAIAAGGGGGAGEERLPSSSVLLERVARAAEQAPPPPLLRDGELWYVRGEGVDQWAVRGERIRGTSGFEGFGVRRRYAVEQWSGLGAEGRIRKLTLGAAPRYASDRELWDSTPRSQRPFPPDSDVVFTRVRRLPLQTGLFAPQELHDLPSEPEALLQAIEAAVRTRASQQRQGSLGPDALATAAFEAIRGLLLLPVAPQQRAALLRAFARLPGTRVARIGSDARGRPGVVLVYTPRAHPRVPRVLVVDDGDGRLLAERGPRGTPETTYVAQGVAPDVLARRDAGARGRGGCRTEPRATHRCLG